MTLVSRVLALIVLLLTAALAISQSLTKEVRFERAVSLLQTGHYGEAIPILQDLAKSDPRAANVYWNLANAQDQAGAHDKALDAWLAFHRLEPDDWRGREKLIQAYQANDRAADASRERDALIEQWKSGRDLDLHKQKRFCREIIKTNTNTIAVFEEFDTSGDLSTYFTFVVKSGVRAKTRVLLGSDKTVDSKLRVKNRLGSEEQLYSLVLVSEHTHESYQFYKKMPPYALIRKDALAALSGESKPLSSMSVDATRGQ